MAVKDNKTQVENKISNVTVTKRSKDFAISAINYETNESIIGILTIEQMHQVVTILIDNATPLKVLNTYEVELNGIEGDRLFLYIILAKAKQWKFFEFELGNVYFKIDSSDMPEFIEDLQTLLRRSDATFKL